MEKNKNMLQRVCLLMLTILWLIPSVSHAAKPADTNVSVDFKSVPVVTVLTAIQKQAGLSFVYSTELAAKWPRISITARHKPAEDVISQVTGLIGCTYQIKGNIVTITQQKMSGHERTVKGQVKDDEGEPLVGVPVSIGEGSVAAVTDADGFYTFKIPVEKTILKFSYVGMDTQYLTITAGTSDQTQNVTMRSSIQLEDVVVNGFFTRQKQTFTGSAKSYKAEEILQISPNNLFQALSTLDPAMTITQNNEMGSNPNAVPDLVIRSTTSLATNDEVGLNAPLVVIDGVEQSLQALYDIDIQDIERVDILKDASATALYGENAANGVIIVERKRVSQSPVRVRYTLTPQLSFADLSSYNLCDAAQKLELERLAGLYDTTNGSLDQSYYDKLALVSSGLDVDWKSKPVRNSFSHNHSLSISGRGSGLDYNITGNYSNTNGVMKGDGRDRYGLGIYLSYRAVENLILTLRASHQELNTTASPYGSYTSFMQANPYDSPYDSYGNLAHRLSYNMNNPLYEASLNSFEKSQNRTEDISLDARYNFKPNFYVTAQGSYSTTKGTSDHFISPRSNRYSGTTILSQKGYYGLGNNGTDSWAAKVVANYIHQFNDDGTMLTLNVGGELKHAKSYNRMLVGTGFLSDDLADIAYATAYPTGSSPTGSEEVSSSVGAFAAANFVWMNRYFVDGSYRISGSSKFGENQRYAPFWSVGLGYNLHNEAFAKDLKWLNTFRLRGSYGYTGSVKFSAWQAVTTYTYNSAYAYYTGVGALPIGMSNPDLKWQATKKLNIGLTSSFFDNRLDINLDVYNEKTDNMLIDLSLPPSSGSTAVKSNLGSQTSNGIEFSIWGKIIKTKDWEWNLSLNGLHSKTTINDISEALKRKNEENAQNNSSVAPLIQFREGESPTAIYAVRSAGVDPASGKEIFIRKDGEYTYTYDANDQVAVGDRNPDWQGSISSLLKYKQFSLSANLSYRFGGDMYNTTRVQKIENINPRYNCDERAFTERWKQPGDLVPYLDISTTGGTSYVYSDRFVEKDNELWLSNIFLQYDVPMSVLSSLHLQKLYVGIGMEDLFRLTAAKYERGTSYPYSRSINMSVSVTF